MIISRIVLHRPVGLLRILTDVGPEGHCTGITSTESDLDGVSPILLNANPLDRERTWWALKELDGGLSPGLRAGIDVALWDLSAKISGRSLFRHINGFRDRVPVCQVATEGATAQDIVREAKEAQYAGFKAYRFSAFFDEASLIHLVSEVRAAVGPDFPLMLDGRTRCMIDEAIRIGKALDDADYFCFDRPRPDNDHAGGRQVACEIDTPTNSGVSSPMEAAQVMASQSADHIRTSVHRAGGFTDALKSTRCAEAFGAFCHLDGFGIGGGFAHLHLAAACRNTPFIEVTGNETASPIVRNPLQVRDGFIQVPDAPGLGMDLDLDAVVESTLERIET